MKIRLGTRKSPLAVWQAKHVEALLCGFDSNIEVEIKEINSDGDQNLVQPLYSFGITGVFTKSLDQALLNRTIDVAVHSLKDIPTELAKGLNIVSVLPRDYNQDILVFREGLDISKVDLNKATIATGSLRRRAFLANEYPGIGFEEIRGNVQTRLKKMTELGVEGTVLSMAGVERMGMKLNYEELDFMLPSAGQGCIALVVSDEYSKEMTEILMKIGDSTTKEIVSFERSFLNKLEGGCTAPIGIRVTKNNEVYSASASILSIDGKKRIDENNFTINLSDAISQGKEFSNLILNNGGKELMKEIKIEIQKIVK